MKLSAEKIIAVILSVCMLLTAMAFAAWAEDETVDAAVDKTADTEATEALEAVETTETTETVEATEALETTETLETTEALETTETLETTEVTEPTEPAEVPEIGEVAAMEITVTQAYQVAAAILTQFIDPAKVKGLENVQVDADHLDNLVLYAKAVGLLKDEDIVQYPFRFFVNKDGRRESKKFNPDAPITRQEYAVIIERVFDLLKVQGIEYSTRIIQSNGEVFSVGIPKGGSSSTSWAKGSGNGSGTTPNTIAGSISDFRNDRSSDGIKGSFLSVDYYRDFKDLCGYAEKAYSFALATGFLQLKKFSETKTVKLPTSDEFAVRNVYFLAPNDILTFAELENGFAVFTSLNFTQYTRQIKLPSTMVNPVKAPTTETKIEDEINAEEDESATDESAEEATEAVEPTTIGVVPLPAEVPTTEASTAASE